MFFADLWLSFLVENRLAFFLYIGLAENGLVPKISSCHDNFYHVLAEKKTIKQTFCGNFCLVYPFTFWRHAFRTTISPLFDADCSFIVINFWFNLYKQKSSLFDNFNFPFLHYRFCTLPFLDIHHSFLLPKLSPVRFEDEEQNGLLFLL